MPVGPVLLHRLCASQISSMSFLYLGQSIPFAAVPNLDVVNGNMNFMKPLNCLISAMSS